MENPTALSSLDSLDYMLYAGQLNRNLQYRQFSYKNTDIRSRPMYEFMQCNFTRIFAAVGIVDFISTREGSTLHLKYGEFFMQINITINNF